MHAAKRIAFKTCLDALPQPVFAVGADGKITYYNEAAAELWGTKPEIGKTMYSGAWRLYRPDGSLLPPEQHPMAVALREKRAIRGLEFIVERPDGTRVPFLPFPTPLFDERGALTGAVSLLIDLSDYKRGDEAQYQLAAIVESSYDAILSKDLNGVIMSWNRGAQTLFGYTADEVIGKPVEILIPADRHNEEPAILARIRRGERIERYETIRRRKDGSEVEISLTVSPVRNSYGAIVGASKIARDISDRRRAEEKQQLLVQEMNHRIKNLFTLAMSVVTLSAPFATTPDEFASAVRARLLALAQAHDLTLTRSPSDRFSRQPPTSLHALIAALVSPFDDQSGIRRRVIIGGIDVPVAGEPVTSLALLLHEFATNAAKYGALSTAGGTIHIDCAEETERIIVTWTETGGPVVTPNGQSEGFGSRLAKMTVKGQFGGEITQEWRPGGLVIRLSMLRDRLLPREKN